MKTPASFSPRRPFGRGGAIPRSGVEAAAALMRTEFERLRHRRELARLDQRSAEMRAALEEQERRAVRLCARILGHDPEGRA